MDKSIYWLGIFLSFFLSLFLAFGFEDITGLFAFHDPSVVAYNRHATYLFVLPLLLYIETSALVFFITALEGKTPIFGNKKFQYGQAPWAKDCFPLFDSRRKSLYVSPSEKSFRRSMIIVWTAGLFLCSLFAPFGFFGRDCLTQNNSIITYNVLNQEDSVAYTTDDYSHLTIQASYVPGYRASGYWEYEIKIRMKDGKLFRFSNRDFDWRKPHLQERCLNQMLDVKAFFPPDAISIKGEDKLEKLSDYLGLNEEQNQLLQELFR